MSESTSPTPATEVPIRITAAAAKAATETMTAENRDPSGTYLRVGVKAGGCSGYSYQLEFVEDRRDDDRVVERDGLRLLVDPKSEVFLAGTELDYSSGLNGKGFVFNNPNASGTCGCGESFSV